MDRLPVTPASGEPANRIPLQADGAHPEPVAPRELPSGPGLAWAGCGRVIVTGWLRRPDLAAGWRLLT